MSDTIIVAVISAAVSLAVSLITTTLKNKADLARMLREQDHGYAKALFEKRVEFYPELYNHLSGYAKTIRSGTQNTENLNEFTKNLDDWNSKHSLFFTKPTSKFSSKFRYFLAEVLRKDLVRKFDVDDWENIRQLIGYFESFLKAEIGIYAVKAAGDVGEFEKAYGVVDRLIEESEQVVSRSSQTAS